MYFSSDIMNIVVKEITAAIMKEDKNMLGIFGDIFDFDGDGELNSVEQAAELITLDRMLQDDDSDDDFLLEDDTSEDDD